MPPRPARLVDLDALWLVTEKVAPVPSQALDALETSLGSSFPADWRALMARHGPGAFVGELRIWGPDDVRRASRSTREHRVFAAENAFWSNYAKVVEATAPEALIPIGCSMNGDELVFAAGRPDRLLLFPRHHDEILEAGPTLATACTTFARGGHFGATYRFDTYDTAIDRKQERFDAVHADETKNIDDLIEAFMEHAEADHDDGDDPPLTFWFRRLQGFVHLRDSGRWIDGKRAPLELHVARDADAAAAWEAIAGALAAEGWRVKQAS